MWNWHRETYLWSLSHPNNLRAKPRRQIATEQQTCHATHRHAMCRNHVDKIRHRRPFARPWHDNFRHNQKSDARCRVRSLGVLRRQRGMSVKPLLSLGLHGRYRWRVNSIISYSMAMLDEFLLIIVPSSYEYSIVQYFLLFAFYCKLQASCIVLVNLFSASGDTKLNTMN